MKLRWLLVVAFASLAMISAARAQGRKSLEPKDGLVCVLVNRNSGRCLSVAARSAEPGAKIVQGPLPAEAGPSEHWKLLATGEAFRLRNENSGLVLEIGKANMNPGVQAIQWHDQSTQPHQLWSFEPFDEDFVLLAGHSKLALAVGQSKIDDGARVIQWKHFPGLRDQLWQLRPTKEGEQPEERPFSLTAGWLLGAMICVGAAVLLTLAVGAGIVLHMRRRSVVEPPAAAEKKDNREASVLTTTCTGCGLTLKVTPNLLGKKVKCTKCGTIVRVSGSANGQSPITR